MLFIRLILVNKAVPYLRCIELMSAVNSHTLISQFILPLSRLPKHMVLGRLEKNYKPVNILKSRLIRKWFCVLFWSILNVLLLLEEPVAFTGTDDRGHPALVTCRGLYFLIFVQQTQELAQIFLSNAFWNPTWQLGHHPTDGTPMLAITYVHTQDFFSHTGPKQFGQTSADTNDPRESWIRALWS